MRPSVRLLNREVPTLHGPKSLYLCSTCKQEVRPRPFPVVHQHRRNNTSGPLSFTERMRRKIWGTDKPPGAKDPYGGQGVIERTFREKLASSKGADRSEQQTEAVDREEGEGEEEELNDIAPPDEYVAAETWDGLERVGHLGRWSDFAPTEADTFTPFKPRKTLNNLKNLSIAAHHAAVEVAIMRALKKPLINVCNVLKQRQHIVDLIWACKIHKPTNDQWDEAIVFPSQEAEQTLFTAFAKVGNRPGQAVLAGDVVNEDNEPRHPKTSFVKYSGFVRDKGFLSLPLNDPATKFAFLKRLSQLSGHFFPDNAIQSFTSVNQTLTYVNGVVHPKRKRLAAELLDRRRAEKLPNVKISARRQTRAFADEEIGRRKVIENELRARGLVDYVTWDGRVKY